MSIIYLQLGPFSNEIGKFLWATEIDLKKRDIANATQNHDENPTTRSDTVWQESQRHTKDGHQTIEFRPRLVSADIKSNIPSSVFKISSSNIDITSLQQQLDTQWNTSARTTIHQATAAATAARHAEHQKDWADDALKELDLDIHNIYELPLGHINNVTDANDFRCFAQGDPNVNDNAKLRDVIEDVDEKIRYWAERCDNLSAFYIVYDVDSGWSGLATNLIQTLREEYRGVALMIFPVCEKLERTATTNYQTLATRRLLNYCLSISGIYEPATIIMPLNGDAVTVPRAELNGEEKQSEDVATNAAHANTYVAQLFASAIHNFSLPHRFAQRKSGTAYRSALDYAASLFNDNRGLKFVGVNAVMPFKDDSFLRNPMKSLDERMRPPGSQHHEYKDTESKVKAPLPLWIEQSNTSVTHVTPLLSQADALDALFSTKRYYAQLVDADDSGESDGEDGPTHGRTLGRGRQAKKQEPLITSEWIVCRGLTDKQQQSLTVNYDEAFPTALREYSYNPLSAVQPCNFASTSSSDIEMKPVYTPAVFCVYHMTTAVYWLETLANSALLLLSPTHTGTESSVDNNAVQAAVQHQVRAGYTREELRAAIEDVKDIADAGLE